MYHQQGSEYNPGQDYDSLHNPYDAPSYPPRNLETRGYPSTASPMMAASTIDQSKAQAPAMTAESSTSRSSQKHQRKQQQPVSAIPEVANGADVDLEDQIGTVNAMTPMTTLPKSDAGHQTRHIHASSDATVAVHAAQRMSRISQAAPSEATRIVSTAYQHWPKRPEPITAVLGVFEHLLWVLGTLGAVAGAGAVGVIVCIHLDVSAAAWMVYILAYFLLSFLFMAIMGREMRIYSERRWQKALQKIVGTSTTSVVAPLQDTPQEGNKDNGHLSSDGQNYQIGEADDTMATENGEAYALLQTSNGSNGKRQSVAFRSPDRPSPVKETQDAPEYFVPESAYNQGGYGAVPVSSPSSKLRGTGSRALKQIQRGAEFAAHATRSVNGTAAPTQASVPSPNGMERSTSAAYKTDYADNAKASSTFAQPSYPPAAETIPMQDMYSSVVRPTSFHASDKEMTIDFRDRAVHAKAANDGATVNGYARQVFDGAQYGRGHYKHDNRRISGVNGNAIEA
ncbi:unnamed protein product [Sympodiomycopsis kandeliae]